MIPGQGTKNPYAAAKDPTCHGEESMQPNFFFYKSDGWMSLDTGWTCVVFATSASNHSFFFAPSPLITLIPITTFFP